jgi:hypothetical protein
VDETSAAKGLRLVKQYQAMVIHVRNARLSSTNAMMMRMRYAVIALLVGLSATKTASLGSRLRGQRG